MTNPESLNVQVEQVDRNAAAALSASSSNPLWSQELAEAIRSGKRDIGDDVRAFAAHRQAAYNAGRIEGEREGLRHRDKAIRWANQSVQMLQDAFFPVADALRALEAYLRNTPHHNAIEAAAARKVLAKFDDATTPPTPGDTA